MIAMLQIDPVIKQDKTGPPISLCHPRYNQRMLAHFTCRIRHIRCQELKGAGTGQDRQQTRSISMPVQ